MSGNTEDQEEAMDTTPPPQPTSEPAASPPSSQNHAQVLTSSRDEEAALIALSVECGEPAHPPEGGGASYPQKLKRKLQQIVQSWLNRNKIDTDCTVVETLGDGRFLAKIKPVPDVDQLRKLNGETLTSKDGKTVAKIFLREMLLEQETHGSLPPSVSGPQNDQLSLVEQNSLSSAAAISTAGQETCSVPVSHFWYMSHIYQEEMKRIEKENGVKIDANVKVTLKPDKKNGDPKKAVDEFINLVQKCLGESSGSVFSLKHVDPHACSNTMEIIQKNENKVLLTLSSEEITVCGPIQSRDAISKSLNAPQKISTNTNSSVGEASSESYDTLMKIDMSIKDPLVDAGLTFDKHHWMVMTASFSEHIANIKSKFGVDLKVSEPGNSPGQVNVKACYRRSGGNMSMESHATRALLHLYQKITTSPMSLTKFLGAIWISGSPKNMSNEPVFNEGSGHSNTEAPTGKGATRDSKDETCPICMDTLTDKKQLKCKHEFCDICLKQAEKSMGPICPICKDVFGVIEGDQPDGKMSWRKCVFSLPGFPDCGSIEINYYIPGGIQTMKHPNPGQYYSAIQRTAYLPDNKEGNEVLHLLKRAFDQKLIFTVGTSRTTGIENQVTWNDIHHKTSRHGGPESFGYPDPDYLNRVREELKAKGIK